MAGAGVGFAVGLTGIGGGSLMTPLLLLFGFPPHIAVGTDLLYAAITKSSGVVMHHKQQTIDWSVARLMTAGSIPAALITLLLLKTLFTDSSQYTAILTTNLGFMLIMTSLVLILRQRLLPDRTPDFIERHRTGFTVGCGIFLGIFVTLSSVGAGAIGTAILMLLAPAMLPTRIVGTDLAHAVPLTFVAGAGHFLLGNVDFLLLGTLLIGSLPAIWLGTRVGRQLPAKLLQLLLATILMVMGLKYSFF
ncbi:sulfite exporter TauE/SafE family protein [Spongorhabdus nitratireducens]